MNIAMVDDNQADLDKMKDALTEYAAANGTEIAFHPFLSGETLLTDYRPFLYAVVFLDIFMDGMTGIEVAEKIRATDDNALLVFLTDSDECQADAIHWNAYDYILKSDWPDALWKVMNRIFRIQSQREESRFSFSSDRKDVALLYGEILFLRADRNYLIVRDKGGTEYRARMTFSSVAEKLLRDARFLEIARGVIVNLEYVTAFTETVCVLKDGSSLSVSIRNAKRLTQIWRNYLFLQTRNQT
ncbi:MAG: response regulator transcription factor [Oscillibacter sp.]|nr:response regulator transcription factor [Oscillibacter sp.]